MDTVPVKLAYYWPNLEVVREDGEDVDILAKSKNFIAYFRKGRSVYKGAISGSQYEPARIVFAEIDDKLELDHQMLKIMLEAPVRGK